MIKQTVNTDCFYDNSHKIKQLKGGRICLCLWLQLVQPMAVWVHVLLKNTAAGTCGRVGCSPVVDKKQGSDRKWGKGEMSKLQSQIWDYLSLETQPPEVSMIFRATRWEPSIQHMGHCRFKLLQRSFKVRQDEKNNDDSVRHFRQVNLSCDRHMWEAGRF